MKIDMRKIVVFTALILVAVIGLAFLSSCGDNTDTGETFTIEYYEKPEDVSEHSLTIEWLNAQFNPSRPTAILFNGRSYYDQKESLVLPDAQYFSFKDGGVLSSYSESINLNLATYWRKMGFNIGVFHYEDFADDTETNLSNKVYNASAMTYLNTDGERVTQNLPTYTLTEAFVMEWLKLMETSPITGTKTERVMEVRFIGNGSGANLALSAADYLSELYNKGFISGSYVPNRIAVLNPYFDNKEIDLSVTYGNGAVVNSMLSYAEKLVKRLADTGIVFDMVENDKEFFFSYEDDYTGVEATPIPNEDTEAEIKYEYKLGDTGDALLYKNIMKNTAYLTLSEAFSAKYGAEYKTLDRAVRDWYLYTVNGSDDPNTGNQTTQGYDETRPMLDHRTGSGSSTVLRYSVSAWTPTSFMRALKGSIFVMEKGTYDSSVEGSYKYGAYTLNYFETETYQRSTMEGATVCGYIYWRKDDSDFINYAIDTRLANVEVRIMVNLNSSGVSDETISVRTDAGGFYRCEIPSKHYEKILTISVILPFRYSASAARSEAIDYQKLSLSNLNETGNTLTFYASGIGKYQVSFKNCGLNYNP